MTTAVPPSLPRRDPAPVNVVTEVIEDAEEFLARPGGIVDRHRQEKARREAMQHEREHEAERIEAKSYKAVKTADQSPENFSVNVVNVQPGACSMILPLSPYRHRATVVASIATGTGLVLLGKDASQVLGGIGFPLVTGTASPGSPLVLSARAQLWAYNPGATVITVAAIAEMYAPET